jgi:hypothetical protein
MTPTVKATGDVVRLSRNWYFDVGREGATNVVGYAWAKVSGDAVLDSQTSDGTGVVSGGTPGTVSVFSCTALLDNGARIVHTWQVLATAGTATSVDSPFVFYGVGAAGRSSLVGLTSASETTIPFTFTVVPAAQKVYVAWRTSLGMRSLWLDGWLVDVLAPTTITSDSVDFYLLESRNALTGSLSFEMRD